MVSRDVNAALEPALVAIGPDAALAAALTALLVPIMLPNMPITSDTIVLSAGFDIDLG